jgi:glutaredoxin
MPTDTTRPVNHLPSRARQVLAAAGLLAMLAPGAAWALYKVVGPDGRVTYTDRAPGDRSAKALNAGRSGTPIANLPYELRKVAERYPVVLYTGNACMPCDNARALLKGRGIPFQELTVSSNDDITAYQRKEGTDQLPLLRIGSQQLPGLSTQDWNSYLDTAGYPASSQLPGNYSWPAPTPLTSPKPAASPSAPAAADLPPPAPTDTAPKGFRF